MNRWHRYQALQGKLSSTAPVRSEAERRRALQEVLDSQEAQRAIRAEDHRRRVTGLGLTVLVAILAHAAVLLPLFALWVLSAPPPLERTQVRWVSMGNGARSQPHERLTPERVEQREEKRKDEEKPAPEEEPPGQIVALPRSSDERPEHADYVSETNHKTDRETVSRSQSQSWKNAAHKPQVGREEPEQAPTEGSEETRVAVPRSGQPGGPEGAGLAPDGDSGTDKKSGRGAPNLALEIPRQEAREKLELDESPDGRAQNRDSADEINSNGERLRVSLDRTKQESQLPGEGASDEAGQGLKGGTGDPGLPDLAALTPSLTEIERLSGMPANDYLPEVETDAETRLNAWRWKHSTFFNRIQQAVNRQWRGLEAYNRHDPTREVYGTQERITWLRVTIDRSGNVVELNVVEPSGADFLDDEAVRTMKVAGPFPNPPEALFGDSSTFTFGYGFVIHHSVRHLDFDWRPY